MQGHIFKKWKPSCTHVSPRVTLQVLKKGFVKGEALRILQKTPQKQLLRKIIQIKKKHLMDGGYAQTLIETINYLLSEIKIHKRESKLLKQKTRRKKKYCKYQPSVSTIKEA